MLESIIKAVKSKLIYIRNKNIKINDFENEILKMYLKRTGEVFDINSPKKYTEKMQYAKLYLYNPLKTKLSDKYLVREWVENKIGNEYLIPILGVWNKYSDIKFDKLPKRFVLKTNHGSATNVIVKDKDKINQMKTQKRFNNWLNTNYAYIGLELQYKNIEPKIIAEEYIEDSEGELKDYKFLCFNGVVYYCWVDIKKNELHYRNIYDLKWNLQPWRINIYNNSPDKINKPINFEKMIEIAEILCQGFSHVRVDLYNVDGKIYFGEMTFTTGAGFVPIKPEKYNYLLGSLWELEHNL